MSERDMAEPRICQGGTEVVVEPLGAQLRSIRREGLEYLWQGDERWWPRRAPILFPIVGRLRDDRATTATGEVSMGQHGIARNMAFEVEELGESRVTLVLESYQGSRTHYPYDFRLALTYAVDDRGVVSQTFTVTNTGEVPMPFVVGGHPAFNVPVGGDGDETFEDYEILFERPMTWQVPRLSGGLIDWGRRETILEDERVIPLTHGLFEKDALIFQDVPGSCVTLRSRRSGRGLAMDFPGFEYLGIWSAKGDAPFVALEPWEGCATGTDEDDVLEHKRGMLLLAPGETHEATFTMRPL